MLANERICREKRSLREDRAPSSMNIPNEFRGSILTLSRPRRLLLAVSGCPGLEPATAAVPPAPEVRFRMSSLRGDSEESHSNQHCPRLGYRAGRGILGRGVMRLWPSPAIPLFLAIVLACLPAQAQQTIIRGYDTARIVTVCAV